MSAHGDLIRAIDVARAAANRVQLELRQRIDRCAASRDVLDKVASLAVPHLTNVSIGHVSREHFDLCVKAFAVSDDDIRLVDTNSGGGIRTFWVERSGLVVHAQCYETVDAEIEAAPQAADDIL